MKPKTNSAPDLRFPEFLDQWIQTSLGTTEVKIVDGDRGLNYPNADDLLEDGFCLFLNAKNVTRGGFVFTDSTFISKEKDEKLRKGKLKRDDIVLTTRGTVGNVAHYNETVPFDHIRINSGMVLIRNESKNIDSRFLYTSFFSPNLRKQISTIAFGSAQPALTVGEINKFKISLPSATEQQKIAAFLSAVDEKVRQLAEKKELLLEYKKGVMQQIFDQKIRFKAEDGIDFSEWTQRKLGEFVQIFKGSLLSKADLNRSGKFEAIHYGELFTTYTAVVHEVVSRTDIDGGIRSQVGDILMPSSDVTPQGLGRASALLKADVVLGGDINVLRPSKAVDSVFLSYLINFKKRMVIRMVSGTTVKHIYPRDIQGIVLDVPSSKAEQEKIAQLLFALDEKIAAVIQQLEKTKIFKQGLLQQMFV